VTNINACKATLAYVDFDGVISLPALSTMTEVLYTRYVTLFKVSMTHESQNELFGSCNGAIKILVVLK